MKCLIIFALLVAGSQAIKWSTCGGSALKVKNVNVAQDPINFPGPLDVSFEAETLHDMAAPIKIKLSLKKNGLELPCVPIGDKNLGSCTYDDICETLKRIPDDCRSGGLLGNIIADAGLPCRCPLHKNPSVSVKNAHVDLPKVPSFIAFLAEGEINIRAEASDGSGNLLGCVELTVNTHFAI